MRGFWLLVHNLGYALWLGGGIATMVSGVVAKSFPPAERLAVYRVNGAIQRILVMLGAVAVTASGLVLAVSYMGAGAGMPGWLNLMMGLGLVGALLATTISVPTAARLARLELDARGELPETFARLRKRQAIAASIAGAMAILALAAGTVLRP